MARASGAARSRSPCPLRARARRARGRRSRSAAQPRWHFRRGGARAASPPRAGPSPPPFPRRRHLSPLRSSRCQTVTMGPACLRWWMSHRLSVCTLCWELLSSDSFRSSADSEKDDMAEGRRGGGRRGPARPGLARPCLPPAPAPRLRDDQPPQNGRPAFHPGAAAGQRTTCYGSPEGRKRARRPPSAEEAQLGRAREGKGREGRGACAARPAGPLRQPRVRTATSVGLFSLRRRFFALPEKAKARD